MKHVMLNIKDIFCDLTGFSETSIMIYKRALCHTAALCTNYNSGIPLGIVYLFDDTSSSSDCIVSNDTNMMDEGSDRGLT
jgi:hypothetical protein